MAGRRTWRRLTGLLLAPAVLYGLLRWFEYRTVFQPTRNLDATGRELGRPVQDLEWRTADGVRLHGWYYPPAAGGTEGWVFLVTHGNGGNLSHRLDLYSLLLATGAGVLAFDYRGYGRSEGRPGEAGTYRDAEAAHDWLVAQGWPGDRIVLFGESLGGAVAAELARRRPVAGLVLLSAFTSVADVGREIYPWLPVRWLGTLHYRTREKLATLQRPVLLLHGPGDSIIPYRHAEQNLKACGGPARLVPIAGDHNDAIYADRATILAAVQAFLDQLPATPAIPANSQSAQEGNGG